MLLGAYCTGLRDESVSAMGVGTCCMQATVIDRVSHLSHSGPRTPHLHRLQLLAPGHMRVCSSPYIVFIIRIAVIVSPAPSPDTDTPAVFAPAVLRP